MIDRYTCKRWILAILVLAALGHDSLAWALEATISARYRGDAQGKFENTTPQAGFCTRWPADCINVQTVGLPIEFTKTAVHRAPDSRDRFFVQLPSSRTVNVSHAVTGESHELAFEITHVSQRVMRESSDNSAFSASVYGGCNYKSTHDTRTYVQYLWAVKNPSNPSGCYDGHHSNGATQVTESDVMETGIAYTLKMPPPLKMKQGIYRGSIDFTVGPGGDFDFGNGVTHLNDSRLTLNFELDVQHAFVLQFPPGSDRAVLEPPGGWQAWLGGRGRPPRLERDIPFRIWSTGPFKIYKRCSFYWGPNRECLLFNEKIMGILVEVSIDLPPEVHHQGRPVRRLNVPSDAVSALSFDHLQPASNRPANLHFEVSKEVGAITDFPGSTFEGRVTLIFDSDL